jgi:broad specificity phosphatase PhoE
MTRRSFLVLLLAAGVTLRAAAQSAPTVVIIVRHAEKATTPADDPPLTDAGVARARALASILASANVQAVISTPLVRTRETARPVAEERGLAVETVALGPVPEHAKAVADAVRKHAGQTVLVVGHSNTVPAIIAALGGPNLPDLCDSQYSGLYTLVIDAKSTRMIQSSYGAASPVIATGCPNQAR